MLDLFHQLSPPFKSIAIIMSISITDQVLSQLPKEYGDAVQSIRSRLPVELSKPEWGIICGSGLSGLGDHIVDKVTIEYDSIPVSKTYKTK